MSDPVEKLKQAKNLLEQGLITQEIFDDIQQKVLLEMGMGTTPKPEKTEENPPENDLFGNTQMEENTSAEDTSSLFGATSFQPEDNTNNDEMDLFGATRVDPNAQDDDKMDLFGATKAEGESTGLTMMGQQVQLNADNIGKLPRGTV